MYLQKLSRATCRRLVTQYPGVIIRSGIRWAARNKQSTMRKRDKSDSSICSCTPGGARGTTTVTAPKRKSGKRTAVPQSWEVLELAATSRGSCHTDAWTLLTLPDESRTPTNTGDLLVVRWPHVLTDGLPHTNVASVTRPVPCVCVRACMWAVVSAAAVLGTAGPVYVLRVLCTVVVQWTCTVRPPPTGNYIGLLYV